MPERDVDAYLAAQVDRQVGRIVDKLRRITDEIERMKVDGDPLKVVSDVDHVLRWGYANLPVDSLISAARDLTTYRQSQEA